MSKSESETPRVSTSREALHEIYESALVEVRPLNSGEQDWRLAAEVVRERSQGGVVITAWNPGQLRPTPEENADANHRLFNVLRETHYELWEADGFSPDRSFREPGFIAWGMDAKIGCQIASEFGQFAIFLYRPDGTRSVVNADFLN